MIIAALVAGLLLFGCTQPPTPGCTKDARICPDGSTVGRVPPSCNFAPCPTIAPTPEPTIAASELPPMPPEPTPTEEAATPTPEAPTPTGGYGYDYGYFN